MLIHLAEDVRRQLAALGLSSLAELRDRTDLLQIAPEHATFVHDRKLDFSAFLAPQKAVDADEAPSFHPEGVGPLNQRILEAARPFLEAGEPQQLAFPISTGDRGVLATLSGEIAQGIRERRLTGRDPVVPGQLQLTFTGSAGQGFGAFLTQGLEVLLLGEANDSVGKSMSGGSLVLRPGPTATFTAEENAILGNGALYGATGGRFFARGLAGDRFAVRNSGATAVVEGAGHHACEYMTRGAVAILGKVMANAGAGMTGGSLFLRREYEPCVNGDYLAPIPWRQEDEDLFRSLIETHQTETGSATAAALLADWDSALAAFQPFVPLAVAGNVTAQ
jgi:glutamate synthase domain-containing protein 3